MRTTHSFATSDPFPPPRRASRTLLSFARALCRNKNSPFFPFLSQHSYFLHFFPFGAPPLCGGGVARRVRCVRFPRQPVQREKKERNGANPFERGFVLIYCPHVVCVGCRIKRSDLPNRAY